MVIDYKVGIIDYKKLVIDYNFFEAKNQQFCTDVIDYEQLVIDYRQLVIYYRQHVIDYERQKSANNFSCNRLHDSRNRLQCSSLKPRKLKNTLIDYISMIINFTLEIIDYQRL